MEFVGVGKRAGAIIIDAMVLFVVGYTMAMVTGETTTAGFNLQGGSAFVFFGIALAYYVVLEATLGGTPGKKALGIRVVKLDGTPLDWQASIVRNLLRFADGFFFYLVGAICVWTSTKKQRIGDMVAGTVVVRSG
jgi:uncharacterized RDD family membrane protein YckC